jgi:hypothetical protein
MNEYKIIILSELLPNDSYDLAKLHGVHCVTSDYYEVLAGEIIFDRDSLNAFLAERDAVFLNKLIQSDLIK